MENTYSWDGIVINPFKFQTSNDNIQISTKRQTQNSYLIDF
jgi:hypothetical protein